MKRKIFSLFLILIMAMVFSPIVHAETVEKPNEAEWLVNGSGNHVWYMLTENTPATDPVSYTLTIGGSGEMPNWNSSKTGENSYSTAPWYGKNITSIIIAENDNVTKIGDYSFVYCESLVSVKLAQSVKAIGNGAFRYCSNLNTIEFNDTLKNIGAGAFYECAFTSLTFPEGLEEIGGMAFQYNDKLTKIVLPSSLQKIQMSAFYMNNDNALKEITSYRKDVFELGNNAFKNVNLNKLTIPNGSLESYQNWNVYTEDEDGIKLKDGITLNYLYTITFNKNDGTDNVSKMVLQGNKLDKPTDPSKENYVFDGWYIDPQLSKQFDFSKEITEDITLYAKWKEKGPIGEISFKENSFFSLLNTITFGLFFNADIEVTITSNDAYDIKKIEYIITDIEKTKQDLNSQTNWINYNNSFNIDDEDKYIIYAKITDSNDEVEYISSDGFIIDKTIPKILGIDSNNGFYYTTQKFTVDDDYIDKVVIDEVEVNDYVLQGNVDKTYEIDVYDKAGNTNIVSVRMMSISSISELLDEYTIENVTIDDKEDIESVKNKVSNIDKTYATDSEKEELQAITDKCDLLLDAIIDKYISKVEFTVTVPRAEQTVADNTFTITSKYDDVVISIKEWKINGGSEVLPSDYVFEKDKLYIPILKVERKNQTYYFNENTTLTIHGSDWSNGEDTYKLKDHKSYGYVKELSDGSFIIDEMLIKAGSRIPNYVFITGDEQEFSQGKINNYSFKLDVDYSLFDTLTIGDLALTEDNDFEINEEENTITFKNNGIAKLNTLEIGNHTITVKFTNDKIVTGTLIINEFVKETVTISGLSFEDKVYDKKPIEPIGTLKVSGNKVPVEDIEVWYENQSDWTKSIEPPINAGNYKVYYNIPESNENYQGSVSYTFKIEKANPKYLLSTKLIGVKGNKLSDVELPDGFSWADEHDELIVGEKEYNVIFTPEDTNNYNILDNIKLSVYTKDIFMVNTLVDGGNGSITTGKKVIEGDKFEIELNPNKGYMINNILLIDPSLPDPDNIIYIDVDTIEDNKYKLTVDKPYTVKVSFKKIEYEVILGSNQTYVINEDKEALFRINAEYSLFDGKVYVDDILLDQEDYSSEEGSTIIKLKKEFIDSLKVGQHELKVEFSDGGSAITNFVIEELKEENPAAEVNPKTGDNITSYLIIGSLSLISLAGCGLYLNRKRFN